FSSLMALYSLSVSCFHVFLLMSRPPPASTLFPYTTLFRSTLHITPYTRPRSLRERRASRTGELAATDRTELHGTRHAVAFDRPRSEEHTSELQSRENLVCRLLLEKKKTHIKPDRATIHVTL